MSIIPFPEKDLAKLVLGYLAEQQLMTIYDEFLQASPYLDAVQNEYDRIFMTSLRSIVAEYRAVKIYLETCKPFSLRKKLTQCPNLLQVVKFLIQHVDMQKLCEFDMNQHDMSHETSFNSRKRRPSQSIPLNQSFCKICQLPKPNKCKCNVQPLQHNLSSSMESIVQQRNIQELEGNRNTLNRDGSDRKYYYTPSNIQQYSRYEDDTGGAQCQDQVVQPVIASYEDQPAESLRNSDQRNNSEEVLNAVTNDNNDVYKMAIEQASSFQKQLPTGDIVHNVTPSVEGSNNYNSFLNVFTLDPLVTGTTVTYCTNSNIYEPSTSSVNKSAKAPDHPELLLQIANVENDGASYGTAANQRIPSIQADKNIPQDMNNPEHSTKSAEQKVTILSNVKVDQIRTGVNKKYKSSKKSQNEVQHLKRSVDSIYVNGTPAYVPETENKPTKVYTKDEIMAMSTVILVPVEGVPSNASSATPISTITSSARSAMTMPTSIYLPLKIDIEDSVSQAKKPDVLKTSREQNFNKNIHKITKVSVDACKENIIESKDSNIVGKTSTPKISLQTKKSSSTPRRTSHIRVLDFNTPRQTKENEKLEASEKDCTLLKNSEVKQIPILETIAEEVKKTVVQTKQIVVNKEKPKIKCTDKKESEENSDSNNSLTMNAVYNWDAPLRAHAVLSEPQNKVAQKCEVKRSKTKPTRDQEKSKNTPDNSKSAKLSDKKKSARKSKSKTINREKRNSISDEMNKSYIKKEVAPAEIPVKPIINIITDWKTEQVSTKTDDNVAVVDIQDTPEMDRSALQTVFDAKLNISDLLETPYKQALLDIQMDTPKFFAPDIPCEPISDIKIMNIPTPKFLTTPGFAVTPKPIQGTPGSYVSRPTDYSSGGSYYKPDDQDYARIIDDVENMPMPSAGNTVNDVPTIQTESEIDNFSKINKSLRPIRQCTKNISYYHSPSSTVKKKPDETDTVSNNSELSVSTGCSLDNPNNDKNRKSTVPPKKSNKKDKSDSTTSETIKKKSTTDPIKKKSPQKRTKNTFIKIKPRRPTPTKLKGKKKSPVLTQKDLLQNVPKKRTVIKDKLSMMAYHLAAAPTRSRRKSSTPRKIHCTKELNSDTSSNISPNSNKAVITVHTLGKHFDSHSEDNDIPHLHWSDEGSQDSKRNDHPETEDITKIKEYIANTEITNVIGSDVPKNDNGGLHVDLVKRGFDLETAKSIERDLLETSELTSDKADAGNIVASKTDDKHESLLMVVNDGEEKSKSEAEKAIVKESKVIDSGSSGNTLTTDQAEECEDSELSVQECNEDSENYFEIKHDESRDKCGDPPSPLKDGYCVEICIDDGVTVKLKLTNCTTLLDLEPNCEDKHNDTLEYIDIIETENAVTSISNMDKLYTPRKDITTIDSKCIHFFGSTLTSLDTPLKSDDEKQRDDNNSTEVVLVVEPIINTPSSSRSNVTKKRKRNQNEISHEALLSDSKRGKIETPLPQLPNIQNIDIESVLSKLHGS